MSSYMTGVKKTRPKFHDEYGWNERPKWQAFGACSPVQVYKEAQNTAEISAFICVFISVLLFTAALSPLPF